MAAGYDLYTSDEAGARALLAACEHGHLAAWDVAARKPAISFMHYALSPDGTEVWGHLANTNPMLAGLGREPHATFTVFGPSAYVPSYYSGEPRGVPTSYYSWGQFEMEVALVHAAEGLLAILEAMLARFQPEGRHPIMDPADRYWQGMLGAITGLRMRPLACAGRCKYGQNKAARVRETIAGQIRQRGSGQDDAVADQVLAFLPPHRAAGA